MTFRLLLILTAICVLFDATLHRSCLAQDASKPGATDTMPLQSIDELLLFFPSKHPAGNWNPSGLKFEDVWFKADDSTQLHGWYCPCEKPRATILIAHGNAGHVASRAAWLKYLQTTLRVSTFMFDYRGYGRSEGTPSVEGVIKDAKAARKKLSELTGVKSSEMLLMGESLGGAIVVQLASDSAPRGLILQSTFSPLRDVADHAASSDTHTLLSIIVHRLCNCPGENAERRIAALDASFKTKRASENMSRSPLSVLSLFETKTILELLGRH